MKAQSLDNLSIVMIGLKGFKNSLESIWKQKNIKIIQTPVSQTGGTNQDN
jgi:hypothetical protein